MFYNCKNLEYINLQNFNEIKLSDDSIHYNNMFKNIPDNVVICINTENTKNKILSQINNIKCKTIDCSNDWRLNQTKIIYETGECIDSCENNITYKYEFKGKCYKNCPNGLINDNNKCKCNDKCIDCSIESSKKDLCIKCNNKYYQKENDNTNNDIFINCYKELEGYYLDNNLYKEII